MRKTTGTVKVDRSIIIRLMELYLSRKLGKSVKVTGFKYWPSEQRDPSSWFDIYFETPQDAGTDEAIFERIKSEMR